MKITEVKTRDKNGVLRSAEFYYKDSAVIQRMLKGSRETSRSTYSENVFEKIFREMFEVRSHLNNAGKRSSDRIMPENLDMESRKKIQMINEIADSFTDEELQEVKDDPQLKSGAKQGIMPFLEVFGLRPYHYREDVEKTREEVLDLIYNELGTEWFVLREFKPIYEKNYNNSETYTAREMLRDMYPSDLDREPVTEEDGYNDGRIKYKYRLNDKVLREIKQYGGLQEDGLERWEKKKFMVEKPKTAV